MTKIRTYNSLAGISREVNVFSPPPNQIERNEGSKKFDVRKSCPPAGTLHREGSSNKNNSKSPAHLNMSNTQVKNKKATTGQKEN